VERADVKRHSSKYASVKDEKVDVGYNKYGEKVLLIVIQSLVRF